MGVLVLDKRKAPNLGVAIASYTGEYAKNAKTGQVRFLTSGVLVLSRDVVVDIFLVGAGGAGRYGGGGGGYTKTVRGITLTAGTEYEIVIGEGGVATTSSSASSYGTDGEATTAFGYTAEGGKTNQQSGSTTKLRGGAGGSGGGAGTSSGAGADGGSNGMSGGAVSAAGGVGQGYTTRAFGEETGALYGAGGGGCPGSASDTPGKGGEPGAGDGAYGTDADLSGEANTGSGGGGTYTSAGRVSNGGSGIVIVRPAVAAEQIDLYRAGNEHEGLTGGWTATAMNGSSAYTTTARAPKITRGEDSIMADNSGSYGGVFRTALSVDLTQYKTVVFEGEFKRSGSYATGLRACAWSELSGYYGNNILANVDAETKDPFYRIELDVSAVEGVGIIGFGMSNAYVQLTSCYMIPKDVT